MAKAARFARGSSGSPKHTEVRGAQGYDAGHVGESGPRVGPGVEGRRVTPTYASDSTSKNNGVGKVKGMRVYREGE